MLPPELAGPTRIRDAVLSALEAEPIRKADLPKMNGLDELARRVANATGVACLVGDSLESAIERAEELAGVDDRVLLTGSFYLVGPALNQLYSRRYS